MSNLEVLQCDCLGGLVYLSPHMPSISSKKGMNPSVVTRDRSWAERQFGVSHLLSFTDKYWYPESFFEFYITQTLGVYVHVCLVTTSTAGRQECSEVVYFCLCHFCPGISQRSCLALLSFQDPMRTRFSWATQVRAQILTFLIIRWQNNLSQRKWCSFTYLTGDSQNIHKCIL